MFFYKLNNIIKKLFSREGSISKKTIQGTFWLFAFRVVDQSFAFAQTIILAHIISPQDFGLFGIAFISISVLDSLFSQTGFQQALIQKKDSIESYLDTAWVIQLSRAVILTATLILIAPFVASIFNTPQAALISQVVALSILIQGFVNVGLIYFNKALEFNKYFIYQFFGRLVDFAVVAAAAFIFRNVWALVFGLLAGNLMRLVVSYALQGYRPHFRFDYKKAKELFNFGKWVYGSNIISFFMAQGDTVFVAKMLGALPLGFYQVGYKISSIASADIISGAIFPAYSKIQYDMSRLREAYLKTAKILFFIMAPVAGGIIAVAAEFTVLFLGRQWLPSVPIMLVLSLSGFVSILGVLSAPVLKATGKPKIETKYNVVRLVVLMVLLFPLIKIWGILGASITVLLSVVISMVGMTIEVIKITECHWFRFIKEVVFPIASSLLMIVFVSFAKNFIAKDFIGFFILVSLGVVSYFFFIFLSAKFLNYRIYATIKESFLTLVS